MSIPYTYTIAKVDAAARCMEVVFQSEGRREMRVCTRIPAKGESLDAVMDEYAPVTYWHSQEVELEIPEVGLSGGAVEGQSLHLLPADEPKTVASTRKRKLAEIADWRYKLETAGVRVGPTLILTDRGSQAQITGAYTTLKNGLLPSVNWKGSDGNWAPLTLAEIEPVAAAVAQHVQACFDAEMALCARVDEAAAKEATEGAAAAIAAIEAVVLA